MYTGMSQPVREREREKDRDSGVRALAWMDARETESFIYLPRL